MFLGHDLQFWIALGLATIVRIATSPFHSFWRAILMILTSVFVAWVFTDSAVDWLHLDPTIYRAPMGALLALTADGFVRVALNIGQDPSQIIKLWRRLRGGGE